MAMSQDVKVALVLATFGLLVLFGLKYSSGKYEPVKPPPDIIEEEKTTREFTEGSAEEFVNLTWKSDWPGLDQEGEGNTHTLPDSPESQKSSEITGSEKEPSPEAVRYTVQAGDTFASISKRFYGTKSKWRIIFDANRDLASAPEKLRAGTVLMIPHLEESPSSGTGSLDEALEIPGTYVVQPGDTLSSIATKVYGSQTQWRKIYEANSEILPDPSILRAGQRLRIPE